MTSKSTLALLGGQPAVTNPLSPWPIANERIRESVRNSLESGQWGKYEGELTEQFSTALRAKFQRQHDLLCCSGTIAVELALRGVGVKPNDEVIMAAYDFPGNFRAVEAIGAKPVLVDVMTDGWLLNPGEIEYAISDATAAILVSHLHGNLAPIQSIVDLAGELSPKPIPVVEDACQVPGATINEKPTGSLGDVSVFSFGGSKLLSAGRGGAILSNDESIIQRAKIFANRGNDAFPLSQLQAAALLPQLDQLDALNQKRNASAKYLYDLLKDERTFIPRNGFRAPDPESKTAIYKVPWLVSAKVCSRKRFLAAAQAEGIPIDIGFRGFAKRSSRRCRTVRSLENAIVAAEQTALLHHPVLLENDDTLEQVVEGFKKISYAAMQGELN
jgi:dTDP-4-amino-4,6-dideoxygalactose transaminase